MELKKHMPNKKRSKKLLEAGLCVRCGGSKNDKKAVCQSCRDHSNAYLKKLRLERLAKNLCTGCGKRPHPEGFQTLCYNCNIGKHRNGGICPHQHNRDCV